MRDFDSWINSIIRELKKEVEKEIKTEFEQVVVIYAEMFHEAVQREWESYRKEYQPKMYERTGMTSAGIIVDDRPEVQLDGTIQASVEFVDSFMHRYEVNSGTERNVFIAMNDGWGDQSLRRGDTGYLFRGFDGLHILETVEREIKAQLPPYVKLEIKRR